MPPRRSKQNSKLHGKQSAKLPPKESLEVVDENSGDTSAPRTEGSHEQSKINTGINNVDYTGYFDFITTGLT